MTLSNGKLMEWTEGLTSKSDKIRALGRRGVETAEIARYLGIRYQHARNVLMACGLHKPKAGDAFREESAAFVEEEARPTAAAGVHAWIELSKDGTLAIAPELLAAAGLEQGAPVHVRLNGDGLEVLSRSAALRRAQQLVRRYVPDGVSLVDELIAERRREAEHESAGAR